MEDCHGRYGLLPTAEMYEPLLSSLALGPDPLEAATGIINGMLASNIVPTQVSVDAHVARMLRHQVHTTEVVEWIRGLFHQHGSRPSVGGILHLLDHICGRGKVEVVESASEGEGEGVGQDNQDKAGKLDKVAELREVVKMVEHVYSAEEREASVFVPHEYLHMPHEPVDVLVGEIVTHTGSVSAPKSLKFRVIWSANKALDPKISGWFGRAAIPLDGVDHVDHVDDDDVDADGKFRYNASDRHYDDHEDPRIAEKNKKRREKRIRERNKKRSIYHGYIGAAEKVDIVKKVDTADEVTKAESKFEALAWGLENRLSICALLDRRGGNNWVSWWRVRNSDALRGYAQRMGIDFPNREVAERWGPVSKQLVSLHFSTHCALLHHLFGHDFDMGDMIYDMTI